MLTLSENDVRSLLPMGECIRLMRETFEALAAGTAINQPRRRMYLASGSVLHSMGGAIGAYFGTKYYAVNVKHGAHFYLHLFDAATAAPLAMMEANWLGQIRTGAASGYATDLLARKDARVLGVIGSGFQARSQIEAIRGVRPIEQVLVYSRDAAKREACAAECSATAAATAEQAVRDADIVVTATFAKDPVIEDCWIRPGTHINAMGSNNPQRRELPSELVRRATKVFVDSIEQARIESGDLLLAWSEAEWQDAMELKDAQQWARTADDITIFKSNGLGVEDIAAAGYVYERALTLGR